MQLHLNIVEMLPKIREAFDNKTLQMFINYDDDSIIGACKYSGPCAIGVCMTPEQREYYDNQTWSGITSLMNEEKIIVADEHYDDVSRLQRYHDVATNGGPGSVGDFEALLIELEQKYLG